MTKIPVGILMYDIDNTVTCGDTECSKFKIDAMKKSIQYCKQNNVLVMVNTARPEQHDNLHSIPSKIKRMLNNVKVYTRKENSDKSIPEDKYSKMLDAQRKFVAKYRKSLPLSKIAIVDDRKDTCDFCARKGAASVYVRDENGLTYMEMNLIKQFVDFCSKN